MVQVTTSISAIAATQCHFAFMICLLEKRAYCPWTPYYSSELMVNTPSTCHGN
jgi:hypothetical protein